MLKLNIFQGIFWAIAAAGTAATAATNITVGGLSYQISGNYAYVVAPASGTQYSGDIVIPESVTAENGTTYTVTKILSGSFKNSTDVTVTSITVPASVTEIQAIAFKGLKLNYLYLLDGADVLTIKKYSGSTATGAFDGCTINNLHIGRNVSLNAGAMVFTYSAVGNISWGNDIFVIPADLFSSGCRLIDGATELTIPEGITEIQAGALQFQNLTLLRLPQTLRSMGKGIVDSDFTTETLQVVSQAIVPPTGSVFSNTNTKFKSLTIPASSTKYYRKYGWDKLTVDGTMTETEAEPTSQPTDPVYLTLNQLTDNGDRMAWGSPRYAVQRGDGISIDIEVAYGWRLKSATLEPCTNSVAANAHASAADNESEVSQVGITGPAEGNIYTLSVTGLDANSSLGYILEEETQTSAAMTRDRADNVTVTSSCGIVRVTATADTHLHICDTAGRLITTGRLNAGESTSVRLPSHGIYILNASGKTYKIVW